MNPLAQHGSLLTHNLIHSKHFLSDAEFAAMVPASMHPKSRSDTQLFDKYCIKRAAAIISQIRPDIVYADVTDLHKLTLMELRAVLTTIAIQQPSTGTQAVTISTFVDELIREELRIQICASLATKSPTESHVINEYQRAASERDMLIIERDDITVKYKSAVDENAVLTTEISGLTRDLGQVTALLMSKDRELSQSRKNTQSAESKLARITARHVEKEEQLDEIIAQYNKKKKELLKLKNLYEEMIIQHTAENIQHYQLVEQLRDENNALTDNNTSLSIQLRGHTTNLEKMARKITKVTDKYDAVSKYITHLTNELHSARAELQVVHDKQTDEGTTSI